MGRAIVLGPPNCSYGVSTDPIGGLQHHAWRLSASRPVTFTNPRSAVYRAKSECWRSTVVALCNCASMLTYYSILLLTLSLLFSAECVPASQRVAPPLDAYKGTLPTSPAAAELPTRKLIERCKEYYRESTLDHFSWAATDQDKETFLQRYFVCDEYWENKGPIFFYVGNEADVTLYLNNTGLMWESAEDFGALLVFAEHRYYGKSKPFRKSHNHMQYLTSEQALADYAELLADLKAELQAEHSPVIGFGGSYGGMLATWFRLKYPFVIDGAIAGSAPIWMFFGEEPAYDPLSYSKGVTYDASPEAGSAPGCIPNARRAWQRLFELGKAEDGRNQIRESMRLCPQTPFNGPADADALVEWAASSFDYMAMGNYPYPSPYILNGAGTLPAYPVRAACSFLGKEGLDTDATLLSALADAIGVFYNYSQALSCYDFSTGVNPDTDEDVDDMFWDQPWSKQGTIEACRSQWGVEPRFLWPTIEWGGKKLSALSNVVFSNGLYDPWHGGGVLHNLSDSVISVVIPEGAHHLDLMFSHPLDPESVKQARETQRSSMRQWVEQAEAVSKPRIQRA